MAKSKARATKPKVSIVLDNSIVMAWSFEDESDEYAAPCSTGSPPPAPWFLPSGR